MYDLSPNSKFQLDPQSPLNVFEQIDSSIRRINEHQTEALTPTLRVRANRFPDFSLKDSEILRVCIEAIAYSRQAQSKLVGALIAKGTLGAIFKDYADVNFVASLDPDELLAEHWHKITPIRQKQKLKAMTNCAKVIVRIGDKYGSMMKYLESLSLPIPFKV